MPSNQYFGMTNLNKQPIRQKSENIDLDQNPTASILLDFMYNT